MITKVEQNMVGADGLRAWGILVSVWSDVTFLLVPDPPITVPAGTPVLVTLTPLNQDGLNSAWTLDGPLPATISGFTIRRNGAYAPIVPTQPQLLVQMTI